MGFFPCHTTLFLNKRLVEEGEQENMGMKKKRSIGHFL